MKVFALQDETLDALCFQVLGQTAGVVERTLELNLACRSRRRVTARDTG